MTDDPTDDEPADEPADSGRDDMRIGEVARRVGVSTRTVRYYEQVGLLDVTTRSPGGTRRYGQAELARLVRIRELQAVMGFDLDQIRTIVAAEDRLDRLRAAYGEGLPLAQRNEILLEAVGINHQLRAEVHTKLGRLEDFLADLDRKAVRYRQIMAERHLVPADDRGDGAGEGSPGSPEISDPGTSAGA